MGRGGARHPHSRLHNYIINILSCSLIIKLNFPCKLGLNRADLFFIGRVLGKRELEGPVTFLKPIRVSADPGKDSYIIGRDDKSVFGSPLELKGSSILLQNL